ncbi:hypothetical protein [Erysipelothrix sp. HDW6C]|uniref:hypothetical protein n=1 Tax=Erysipelothrix sp. HDW6C TaxID=2714930 RepID=UPI00196B81FF|nr:hypothetical protein [Erysipelothrix sp. HDW6C]
MKKRIVLSVVLMLALTACGAKDEPKTDENKQNETADVAQTPVTEEKPVVVEKPVEQPVEQPVETPVEEVSLSQDDYIIQTFAAYGFDASNTGNWIVKQEGPNKVAVIIKEGVGRGRPNISKLIFLWNGSSVDAEILFIMVNNSVQYGSE